MPQIDGGLVLGTGFLPSDQAGDLCEFFSFFLGQGIAPGDDVVHALAVK